MSFEYNFAYVCRTCLTQSTNMQSVFLIEPQKLISLCDMLMSFTSLQVQKGDGLPEQICEQCAEELNRSFLFRKMCEKSDGTLRQYIQTLLPFPSNNYNSDYANDVKVELSKVSIGTSENSMDDGGGSIKQICTDNDGRDIKPGDNMWEKDSMNKKGKSDTHKRKQYPCKLCEASCLGLAEYRRHMTGFHRDLFECDVCKKKCKSEASLKLHIESHNILTSPENSAPVYKPKALKKKTGIIKERNLPRTCSICNKTFRFHSNLERHKLIHTGEKPYLCNVCGKGFAQLSYLKIHSFIHTGEKPYKCKVCEKSFAAPGTLMTHVRTHTGERPHICKICGKDFPQSGYLSAHIRTHTGEKPVECKVCNRRFNQSGRLIIHMRIHSGEKPYNCSECGRSFAVKGTLKKHIRTHTGEKPYICRICGQAFAQSGTLATHTKIHARKVE